MRQLQFLLDHVYFKCLMLALAGFIGIYAFAPYNISICMLLSLLILLWVVNRLPKNLSKWQILGYGFIYGYAYFNTQIYWLFYAIHVVIGADLFISIIAIICFSAFLAMPITLAVFCYVKLKTKTNLFNQLFLFPSIWVIFEWFRGWFLGGFSWCDVGYIQVNNTLFRGFFAIIGEYGVSWLSVSLIGSFYLIIERFITNKISNKPKRDYRLSVVYLALILVLGYALESVRYTREYGKPSTLALIQGNIGVGTKWSADSALDIYAKAIKMAHADIVMIPETGIAEYASDLPKGYLADIESVAKQNGANLIVGMPLIIDKQNNYVNAAIVLTLPGHPYYAKHHLVPYGEYIPAKWILGPLYKFISLPLVDFSAGSINQAPLLVGGQKLALNICFENGFGSELINAAAQSTMMVNLSDMVWYGKTVAMNQHLQLSQARALENQRYFVQETNTSITAIINQYGQIQSQLPVFIQDTLRDSVQGMIGVTPYERFGNWLIITLCSLILLLAWFSNRNVQ